MPSPRVAVNPGQTHCMCGVLVTGMVREGGSLGVVAGHPGRSGSAEFPELRQGHGWE